MRLSRVAILVLMLVAPTMSAAPDGPPATQPASRPAAVPVSASDRQPIRFSGGVMRSGAAASRPTEAASFDTTRWVLSLAAVIGLIFSVRYVIKHLMGMQPGSGGGAINVIARQTLAPRQQLLLIQVGRRVVLASSSSSTGQMNTLAEITDADEIAEIVAQTNRRRVSAAAAFGSVFGKAGEAYEAPASEPATEEPAEAAEPPADSNLSATRVELKNLMEKVRLIAGVGKRR